MVVKREVYDFWGDGTEHVSRYKLINDSLKLVEQIVIE
jgi:hypothetical protein